MTEPSFTTFLTLFFGRTLDEAKLVGVTTDADLVALVAARLLEEPEADDPVEHAVQAGERAALRLIQQASTSWRGKGQA